MNEMTRMKRPRRQFTAEDRAQWLDLYEHSGKGVREFCRDNAVCQSSLSRWLRQRRGGADEQNREGSLVEVRVAPAPTAAATVAARVQLAGGMTMEVVGGTDAAWLASVLRALQSAQA
jgi:transposase-like protein